MARKNYSKYSQQSKKEVEPEVLNEEIQNDAMEEVFEEIINEVIETPVDDKTTVGYLTNCKKLNVRKKADANSEVLCIVDEKAILTIDLDKSTKDFYKVCTSSGIEGYCMKQFIAVK